MRPWRVTVGAALTAVALLGACGSDSKQAATTTTTTAAPPAATSTTAPAPAPAAGAAWTTYGGSPARTAADSADAPLGTPAQRWRSPSLDGAVYAQPLLVGDRAIVATESNLVYAVSRDDGHVLWQTPSLGRPVDGSTLPCGNINPSGITSTPVADSAAGVVYAVAFLADGPHHDLIALDLATGAVRWRRAVDPPGLPAKVEQQRGALAIANGRVYVPFGGLAGDCGPYKGAVVSSDLAGTAPLQSYVVPTTREGGIWSPPGPAVGSDGSVYVATGNTEGSSSFDGGNAVVRLSADLKPLAFFAPANWAALNRGDVDLGSISPVVLPSGRLFVAGKSGLAYLLDPDHLGGVGGPPVAETKVCTQAIGGAAVTGTTVVVSCINEIAGLSTAGDRLAVSWHRTLSRPGPPVVSHGSAWVADAGGTLHALKLTDGTDAFSAPVGPMSRFASVAASGSQVVVAAGGTLLSFAVGS